MEPRPDNVPLVVIVGETASGKTALAVQLAKQFNGEIICADSRTIYKGTDIGTAKPLLEEQSGVPHHMLDVVTVDESFSAADFQRQARAHIDDIAARGKVPFLVGGTGLYIDAVIFNFSFADPPDAEERRRLQTLSVGELAQEIRGRQIPMPTNEQNPRHLMRALETGGTRTGDTQLRPNTLVIGLEIDREVLRQKLTARVEAMVAAGFIDEVKQLSAQYGWSAPGLNAPGYKAFRGYIEGDISLDEAKAVFVQNDWKLAKRQRTWFKRNKSIHWVAGIQKSVELVTTFLNK